MGGKVRAPAVPFCAERFICLLISCSVFWLSAGYLCKDDSAVFGVELSSKATQTAYTGSDTTTCPRFWLDFTNQSGDPQSCSFATGPSLTKLACSCDANSTSVALWAVPTERESIRRILPEVWRALERSLRDRRDLHQSVLGWLGWLAIPPWRTRPFSTRARSWWRPDKAIATPADAPSTKGQRQGQRQWQSSPEGQGEEQEQGQVQQQHALGAFSFSGAGSCNYSVWFSLRREDAGNAASTRGKPRDTAGLSEGSLAGARGGPDCIPRKGDASTGGHTAREDKEADESPRAAGAIRQTMGFVHGHPLRHVADAVEGEGGHPPEVRRERGGPSGGHHGSPSSRPSVGRRRQSILRCFDGRRGAGHLDSSRARQATAGGGATARIDEAVDSCRSACCPYGSRQLPHSETGTQGACGGKDRGSGKARRRAGSQDPKDSFTQGRGQAKHCSGHKVACAGFNVSPLPSRSGPNGREATTPSLLSLLSMSLSVYEQPDFVSVWFAQCLAIHLEFAVNAQQLGVHVGMMDPRCEPLPANLDGFLSTLTEPGCLPQLAHEAGAMPDGQNGHVEPPCDATWGKVLTSSLSHGSHPSDDGTSERFAHCMYRRDCTYSTVHSSLQSGVSCSSQPSSAHHPYSTRSPRKVRFSDAVDLWFSGPDQMTFRATPVPCSADPGVQGCGFTNLAPLRTALHFPIPERSSAPLPLCPPACNGVQGSGFANLAPSTSHASLLPVESHTLPSTYQGVQGGGLTNLAPPSAQTHCTQDTGQVLSQDVTQQTAHYGVQGCGFTNLAPRMSASVSGFAHGGLEGCFPRLPPVPHYHSAPAHCPTQGPTALAASRYTVCGNGKSSPFPHCREATTVLTCCHSGWTAPVEVVPNPSPGLPPSQDLFDTTPAPPVQLTRDAYISRMRAVRIGAVPFQPPAATGRTGFSRPLELAGHTLAVDTSIEPPDLGSCTPFTSFDERNGARVLAGDVTWHVQQFISMAITTAHLLGQPVARVLGYEVVSFPSPQIALTQDRGSDFRRAVILDLRSHGGELSTVDLPPSATVLQALCFVQAFSGTQHLAFGLQQATTSCYVNGVVFDAARVLPADADVVQFLDHTSPAQAPITFNPSRFTALALPQVVQHTLPSLCAPSMGSSLSEPSITPSLSVRPLLPGDGRPPTPPIPEDTDDDEVADPDASSSFHGATDGQAAFSSSSAYVPHRPSPPQPPGRTSEPRPASTHSSRWDSRSKWARRALTAATPPQPPLLPLSAMELAECCDTELPSQTFTVFDVHHHARELAAPATFTVQQLARLAFTLTPEIEHPFDYRVLRRQVEGFRCPQLVLRDKSQQRLWTLPVAYPDLRKGVCTVALEPPTSPLQLMIEVQRRCDTPVSDRHSLLHGRASFRLDLPRPA